MNIIKKEKDIEEEKDDIKYKELENQLIEEKNKIKDLNKQINELRRELSNEKDKIKQLTNTNKSLSDSEKILKSELNKEIEKNKALNTQLNELQDLINSKNNEIENLKSNKNESNEIVSLNPGEKVIAIMFSSMDQKIQNFCLPCKNNDIFVKLEEKLYNEYKDYKDKQTYFMVNGSIVKRFKTIEENGIKNGNNILLYIYNENENENENNKNN